MDISSLPTPLWKYGKLWDLTDETERVVLTEDQFASYNDDFAFDGGLNALYFRCKKPYKLVVTFETSEEQIGGTVDILWGFKQGTDEYWWMRFAPLIRPRPLHRIPTTTEKIESIEVYADSNISAEGYYFEPRIYRSKHNISHITIEKTLEFKDDEFTRYALFLRRRAKTMLDLAEEQYSMGDFGGAAHFSDYCKEFSSKSIFPALKQVFPKKHDPTESFRGIHGKILEVNPDFPLLEFIKLVGKQDTRRRGGLYGIPWLFLPSYSLVTMDESAMNLRDARNALEECGRFLDLALSK